MPATETQNVEVTRSEPTRNRPVYCPNVDIIERDEELTLVADMPGTRADDVDIQFENGTLTVSGVVRDRWPRSEEHEQMNFMLREYGVGDFRRTFQVSEHIDAAKISADYENGVLVIHLPKVAEVRPRKIAVKAG